MIKKIKSKNLNYKFSKGFSLIELTFVIAIFGIMASIVMTGFQNFSRNIAFDNLMQDITATVIQAQKAAISGLRDSVTVGEAPPSYGVYFSSYSSSYGPLTPPNKVFKYFSDLNGDGKYTSTSSFCGPLSLSNECLSSTQINTGEYVSTIGVMGANTGPLTYHDAGASEDANIVFTRPFPDAHLSICSHTSSSCYTSPQYVFIEFTSPASVAGNTKRTLTVSNLGRIQLYNTDACTTAEIIRPGSTSCM